MRRKRIKLDRKIKFTNKKQSLTGFFSLVISILSVFFLALSFMLAYESRGTADERVGVYGFFALILGLFGFIVGMLSFRNKDVFYTFSWIGVIISGAASLTIFCIFLIGV